MGKSLIQLIVVVHHEWKLGKELKARIWREELKQSHERDLLTGLLLWFGQPDFPQHEEPIAQGEHNT